MTLLMRRSVVAGSSAIALGLLCVSGLPGMPVAKAQITTPRILSAAPDRTANLTEQLVNRLRAFDQEKRNYVAMVVKKVRTGKLDAKLVLAVQRYAIRRNPEFPFPFFERALRYQAGKRGVVLPTVRQYASTAQSRY